MFKTRERKSISPTVLKRMYTAGSLRYIGEGVSFNIKNLMRDVVITGVSGISIDGCEIPLTEVMLKNRETRSMASEIDNKHSFPFPVGQNIEVHLRTDSLDNYPEHHIAMSCIMEPYGFLFIEATDAVIGVGTT
jgi:hypothetical protein